jgi:serine/threonine-protein kinase
VLVRLGRGEEARLAWLAKLEAAPPDHDAWYGYAEFCLFLGREGEYRRARRDLLARFGEATDPYVAERTGRACLLLPAEGDELRKAAALAERAAGVERSKYAGVYAHFLFARGLAEYRQGRFDRAIAVMRGEAGRVLGPAPVLVLALALHKSDRAEEARRALAAAVLAHDWRVALVRDQDGWICHALRREAEGLILPNLPAFLRGDYQPKDNVERLALIGACEFADRTLALARLCADAIAADPRLADNPLTCLRYRAARAAAQVGCGRGKYAAGEGEAERAR